MKGPGCPNIHEQERDRGSGEFKEVAGKAGESAAYFDIQSRKRPTVSSALISQMKTGLAAGFSNMYFMLQKPYVVGTIITHILQMRKPRLREA